MRTWRLETPGDLSSLRLVEAVQPEPEDGQVLVRVKGACVGREDREALESGDGSRLLHNGRLPVALGFDFAGVIEEVRSGAASFRPGDDVFGFVADPARAPQGPFAEFVAVDATSIARKPAGVSFAEAASLASAGCAALQGLRDKASVASGAAVVVIGDGAKAQGAVQVARALGAEVTAVVSPAGEATLAGLGLTEVRCERDLAALAGPFAAVFDVAGTASFNEATRVLTDDGAYVTLTRSAAFLASLAQSAFSRRSAHVVSAQSVAADLRVIAGWIESAGLKPALAAAVGYKALPDAYRQVRPEAPGPVGIEL